MTIHEHHTKGISLSTITRADERIALVMFSSHIHRPWDAYEEALRLVYTEALLAGAGPYDRASFIDILSAHGVTLNVHHTNGTLTISVSAIDSTVQVALKLFNAIIRTPHFETRELKRIKELVHNRLSLAKEDARACAYTHFSNTLTEAKAPHYLHDLDILRAKVLTITVKDLKKIHEHMLEQSWTIAIAGNGHTATQVQNSIHVLRKTFAYHENEINNIWNTKQISGRKVHLTDIPSKHNIELSVGGSLPLTRGDALFPSFVFGVSVLGLYGGFTGRLMSTVREKEGLTYSIYAQAERSTMTQTGFWRIMTFFNPKDAVKGMAATIREIQRMHEYGITEDELVRFKSILHTRRAMTNDSLQKKIREVHAYMLLGFTKETHGAFNEKLLSVTREEVNDVTHRYVDPYNLVISGAGPVETIRKEFKQFM